AIVIGDPLCAVSRRMPVPREDLEDAIDTTTGLPQLFAKRRLAAFGGSIVNRDIPDTAVPMVVRSETLLERDDRDGARRALQEALRLAPQTTAILVRLLP